MKKWRYINIFMYSSRQFSGHVEEYFVNHTKKLVVFIVMPRLKSRYNTVRVYKEGKLVEEKNVRSSENFIAYYFLWYIHYLWIICTYFARHERFIVFSGHPISFFGMRLQKILRHIIFAYWIGDYFPPVSIPLVLFEKVKKYYHDRASFTYYLSDRINEKLNGRVTNTLQRRTVMWGIKPIIAPRRSAGNQYSLLFIGLIKPSQGLDSLFSFLSRHRTYHVHIVGHCDNNLYAQYQRRIVSLGIKRQVIFPNKFYNDAELVDVAKKSHVGIALYDRSALNATYYTDPGKVKAYAELGLPIVMTNTSGIAPYIRRFSCGEVIDNVDSELGSALEKIRAQYGNYTKGLKKFIAYFSYEQYYRRSFTALENVPGDTQ